MVDLDYKNRLIPNKIADGGENSLEKAYLKTMYGIETALLIAGAEPKEDYDLMYLMELAHPHVLALGEKQGFDGASPFD